ncbi:MAG: hypothetical protein MJZ71_06965 [Bacteroidales bacterium]|nr:hypothetical protein [Bacteroidales bacterium]
MKKLSLGILFTLFSCLLLNSCNDEFDEWGYVNFYIDPNGTEYYNLNIGSRCWEYFYGGNRGVIVFRTSYYDFAAYERTCTVKDCHGRVEVDEETNLTITCPDCGAQYLCVDGSPLAVPGNKAKRALFSYCAYFDGLNLYVYNCG